MSKHGSLYAGDLPEHTSGGGTDVKTSRMYYKAFFEIPITIEVEVVEQDLFIGKAESVLLKRAKEMLDEKYGHLFGMDYNKIKRVGEITGIALDFVERE